MAKKNLCGKAQAEHLFIYDNEPTCCFPTGIAGHLQQGRCVLFTQFPHGLWDLIDSTSEGYVLLRILKNIGFAEDGICYESRESMCRACHVNKDTWRKVIESLEQKQIIVVQKQGNKPYQITLHENYARAKIRTRNRKDNIYRDPKIALALNNGESEYQSEIERIHIKWIKGRYKVKTKVKKEEST